MTHQSDHAAKVNNFQEYLQTVLQNIAAGVRPTDFKDIAPTLSKHYNLATFCTTMEHNIMKGLHRRIGEFFTESDVIEKVKELDELSDKGSTEVNESQSLPSDPLIIRKHWLNHRKEALKRKLQASQQQTTDTCEQIKKKRAIMKHHINEMKTIKNTNFKKILLS